MLGGVRREDHLKYYVAVCLPSTSGGWRAFFPDIPDCAVAAPSLDRAVFRAANALADHTVSLNGSAVDILPLPRDLTAIKADKQWSTAHAVDWSSAVVTLIPQRTANRLEEDHEIATLSHSQEQSAMTEQAKIDDKMQDPAADVDRPHEVVVDSSLSKSQKVKALDALEQDARQLSEASAEGRRRALQPA